MAILAKSVSTNDVFNHVYTSPIDKKTVGFLNITNLTNSEVSVDVCFVDYTRDQENIKIAKVIDESLTGLINQESGFPRVLLSKDTTYDQSVKVQYLNIEQVIFQSTGNSYRVGDVLTLSNSLNPDPMNQDCKIEVLAVGNSGEITNFEITDRGNFTDFIDLVNNADIALSGGNGSSATITHITYNIDSFQIINPSVSKYDIPTIKIVNENLIDYYDVSASIYFTDSKLSSVNYIEKDTILPAGSSLERSGVTLEDGDTIFVKTDVHHGVNSMFIGIEAIK